MAERQRTRLKSLRLKSPSAMLSVGWSDVKLAAVGLWSSGKSSLEWWIHVASCCVHRFVHCLVLPPAAEWMAMASSLCKDAHQQVNGKNGNWKKIAPCSLWPLLESRSVIQHNTALWNRPMWKCMHALLYMALDCNRLLNGICNIIQSGIWSWTLNILVCPFSPEDGDRNLVIVLLLTVISGTTELNLCRCLERLPCRPEVSRREHWWR